MGSRARRGGLSRSTFWVVLAATIASGTLEAAEKASEQVSPFMGSFSQGIPIEVPGFRGLEPKLALGYSSEGRNGFVGVGWTLSGVSTIERANPGRGTPKFDSNDIYLLDGQELVACQGGSVSPSCTTGGTHSTKIESYLKIKFTSSTNIWEVWGKDGTKTVFSAVYSTTFGTWRWGQASAIDTNNNTVTYAWTCLDGNWGDCYPNTVSYNGYLITFYRESRPDVLSFAAVSTVGQTKWRLKTILVQLTGGTKIGSSAESVGWNRIRKCKERHPVRPRKKMESARQPSTKRRAGCGSRLS